jgi:hypothetical protein
LGGWFSAVLDPEVHRTSPPKDSRGSLHATLGPHWNWGGPIAEIGPLAEPNEAMATQVPMEMWFTLENVKSKKLLSGDGGQPYGKDPRLGAQLLMAQVSSNTDVRYQGIE